MAKIIARTYSEALFGLALEKNVLDSYKEEVIFVKNVFAENEELLKLLNHPKIVREEKVKVIEDIFKGRISDDVTGFLVIIVEKGRTSELAAIFENFLNKIKEFKNIGVANVTSATELTGEQKEKILKKLLATTDYVEFEMNYSIDKSLLGGMVIRIGDRVMDSSIKSKLYLMTQNLSKLQLQSKEV